jgi:seryl-tRNA synthetase
MLNIHQLRQNPTTIVAGLARRGFVFDSDTFNALELERKSLQAEVEALQAARNQLAARVGQLKKAGDPNNEAPALTAQARQLPDVLDGKAKRLLELQLELESLLLRTPNVPAADVPDGVDETGNQVQSTYGTPPVFDFPVQDHVALGEQLKGLDFEAGARIAVPYT